MRHLARAFLLRSSDRDDVVPLSALSNRFSHSRGRITSNQTMQKDSTALNLLEFCAAEVYRGRGEEKFEDFAKMAAEKLIIAQLTEEYEAQERDLEGLKALFVSVLSAATAAASEGGDDEDDLEKKLVPLHEARAALTAEDGTAASEFAENLVVPFLNALEKRLRGERAASERLQEATRELETTQALLAASQAREELLASTAAAAAAARPVAHDEAPSSPGKTSALAAAIEAEAMANEARAQLAEERVAQLEKQLAMVSGSYESEVSTLRARVAEGEVSRLQLTASLTGLRKEVEDAHAANSAKDGVISMLREELATAQAKLSKLQLSKAEIASAAAQTMKEMEAQLSSLTGAIVTLKKEQEKVKRVSQTAATLVASTTAAGGAESASSGATSS